MDDIKIIVSSEEQDYCRIDKYITELVDSFSRSYIQKNIENGNILVNGKKVKPSFSICPGDEIQLSIPEAVELEAEPEDIPLDILYEDSDVIVVNKPKNMVVHPAPGHLSGTLVNALLYHCSGSLSGINGVLRPGIVHRIDKNTTGSIIACKNDNAHAAIAAQLKDHSINRRYRAICHGVIKEDDLTINAPIGRDDKDRKKMAINQRNGKEAVTHVHVLERFKDYTYVECVLETGRTHQIRVHLSSLHHPLLGDDIYTSQKSPFKTEGQCLHAMTLGFIHPTTGEYIETNAPLPDYFEKILNSLR